MEVNVDKNGVYVTVDLQATGINWENDSIGSYEFWGYTYYDYQSDYAVVKDFTWDKEKYTDEENKAIDAYIDENFVELSDKYCENLEEPDNG